MEAGPSQALAGRAALVTGGARRIGSALAQALHAAGADILLHYRSSADAARALADRLNESRPGSAVLVQADLLDPEAPSRLIAAAGAAFGRLDILLNNASAFYPTPVGEITAAAWDE